MGAILTPEWLSQPPALTPLRPEYAAVASVCVVGDGNVNIAPVTSANRIVPAVSVTRVVGPAGGGWRSDGTAAPYRNVGKLQKFRGPQGLTLVCVFSGTDTSAIQWLAGTLDTGSNYVEELACNREHTAGAHSAGRLSCQIRDDGSATPTQYSSTAATTFFDGKPHCIVLQWTVATPASLPVARMWVDGIAVALSTNGSGEAFSQAAGLTEFDYYTNTRNLRGTPSASINGIEYLFTRLMSAQFDGKSLSANPWQMFDAGELEIYLPDASAGSYSLTAAAGTFTETGIAASLLAARTVAGDAGTFTETGVAANLLATRTLVGDAGTFTETGIAAGLLATRTLGGDAGSYTETGQDATLTYTPAGAYTLPAAAGAFTETGQDAALLHATLMAADPGSFAFTGQAASLVYAPAGSYSMTAAAGSFAMTGRDVALVYSGATGPAFDPHYHLKYPSGGFYILRPRNNWTIQ